MSSNNKKPKCVPLCYPCNYKWDKFKGTLVEKEKKRGQLVVCEDALEIIRSIDGPICTVAVTGPARSGKSYIASQLIEPRPKACVFKTSHKANPETMGIWMSTDVFKKALSNGTDVTVIILDTEGLDAHNAYDEDDMLMFALMALMSSVLVYNSSKSVYAGDLNKLSWVTELKNVFIGSGDGEQTKDALEDEFIKFFPNFMWLLRDSTMSFEPTRDDDAGNDGNVAVNSEFKNYLLKDILKIEKENVLTETRVKESNATRRALLKSFPMFDALTLPLPSADPSVLKDMDKGKNEGSLNQNFEKDVDVFIARCGALMKPKKAWPYVGNINGHQFTKMLEQYMSVFSETKSINVGAAVTCVITSLLQEVVEMTFKDYCNAMDSYAKASLPCDNYEIIEKHNRCMYTAMKTFKDNAKYVNDAESLEKYRNTLKGMMVQYSDGDVIGGYLDNILKENEKKSDVFCRKLIDELPPENLKQGKRCNRQFPVGLKGDFYNEQYKERARGPKMLHVYKTALAAKIEGISTNREKEYVSVDDKDNLNPNENVTIKEEEIEEMEKKKKTSEQILAMKESEDKAIRESVAADIGDQKKQLEVDFQERRRATQAQIETLRSTHDALVRELKIVLDKMNEAKKKEEEELTRKQKELMQLS